MNFSELIKCAESFRFYIMGNHGVGKSCLLKGFFEGRSTSAWERMLISVDSELKMVPWHSMELELEIWDSPDIETIRTNILNSWSKRNIDAVILVYDCTDKTSFNDVKNLLNEVNQNLSDSVFKLLVGNKCDLHPRKTVGYSTAKKYADEMKIPFMETSALTGPNLKEAFKFFISYICEKKHAALKRKRDQESREREAIERQERMQQRKEQQEREQQARIQKAIELQHRQQQEEKRQREKERREKERLEKDKKYVDQLLSPFLEKLATNATSSQPPLAIVATGTKPQDCPPVEQRENEMMREMEKFDCEGTMADISRRWKKWRKTFELYITVKDITDDARKKATLLYCAGTDVQDIYFALVNGNENIETPGSSESASTAANEKLLGYESAMTLLDNHFTLEKNTLRERLDFRNMRQENDETTAQYAARLKQQARNCNFGKMLEEQIRDQIIETCSSEKMREKFLKRGDKLTLERLLKISTSMEDIDRKKSAQEMNDAVQDANQNHLQEDESLVSCNRCRELLHAAEDNDLDNHKRDLEKDISKDSELCENTEGKISLEYNIL